MNKATITNINDIKELDYFSYGSENYISLGEIDKSNILAYNLNTKNDEVIEGSYFKNELGETQSKIINSGNVFDYINAWKKKLTKKNLPLDFYDNLLSIANELKEDIN